jgi:dTDP-4-dehydrorhamnose reductase
VRILITGAGGQLAQALRSVLANEELRALTRADLDIRNASSVMQAVNQVRPDWLINGAAFTLVDEAEADPGTAFDINAHGTLNLARAAQAVGAVFVHFSTDYVFDGKHSTPYRESDPPNPLNAYGLSKLAGENLVMPYVKRYFVIRTCGLYGSPRRSGRLNFVEQMLRAARQDQPLRVVNNQVVTPTSADELAEKLVPLLRSDAYGLYHLTNAGQCSWYQFAQEIFRLTGLDARVEPVSSETYGARARRPPYSVLDNHVYRAAGLSEFLPWQEALEKYLRTRKEAG